MRSLQSSSRWQRQLVPIGRRAIVAAKVEVSWRLRQRSAVTVPLIAALIAATTAVAGSASSPSSTSGRPAVSWLTYINEGEPLTRAEPQCAVLEVKEPHRVGTGWLPAISADHRFVAFATYVKRGRDQNDNEDVHVRDRKRHTTSPVAHSRHSNWDIDYSTSDPSISAHGRFITFESSAFDLVPRDTNNKRDIFLAHRARGALRIISRANSGAQANGHSFNAFLSRDGGYVLYYSDASNLVRNDTNKRTDIFLHNRTTGRSRRISVSSSGQELTAGVTSSGHAWPGLSRFGLRAVFSSEGHLVEGQDRDGTEDVFLHYRKTSRTVVISRGWKGQPANGDSSDPVISANGRYVGFRSAASNLVRHDNNRTEDLFVRDLRTGNITRIPDASAAQLSRSGRYVAFVKARNGNKTKYDAYVRDLRCGTTTLINGHFGKQSVTHYTLSGNGRHVAFPVESDVYVTKLI